MLFVCIMDQRIAFSGPALFSLESEKKLLLFPQSFGKVTIMYNYFFAPSSRRKDY